MKPKEAAARRALIAAMTAATDMILGVGPTDHNLLDYGLRLRTATTYDDCLCRPHSATHSVQILAQPGHPEAALRTVTYTSTSRVSMADALTIATATLTQRAAAQFAESMIEKDLAANPCLLWSTRLRQPAAVTA